MQWARTLLVVVSVLIGALLLALFGLLLLYRRLLQRISVKAGPPFAGGG